MDDAGPLYRVQMPENARLAESRETEGAFRGFFHSDESNQIGGQAEFFEVDRDEEDEDDEEAPQSGIGRAVVLVGAGIVIGVAAHKSAPHVRRWWSSSVSPRLRSKWDTLRGSTPEASPMSEELVAEPEVVQPHQLSTEVETMVDDPDIVLSSAEMQQRLIQLMLAASYVAQELQTLKSARIEDGGPEQLKLTLDRLSTQSLVDLANRVLEANPNLLERPDNSGFSRIFGGGHFNNDVYVPVEVGNVERALRLAP